MAVACQNPMNNRRDEFQEHLQFQVLRRLHESPDLSQRTLAKELGASLGSINYCFQALMEKGWVKMQNFSHSQHKLGYAYLLTPSGLEAKLQLTRRFLARKMDEYDRLRLEIQHLQDELEAAPGEPPRSAPPSPRQTHPEPRE